MSISEKIVLVLVGAVGGALITLSAPKIPGFEFEKKSEKKTRAASETVPVRTQKIHKEKWRDKFFAVGTLLANESIEIRSEITGKVEKIYFQEGTPIKKGEKILKIADSELQAQLLRTQHRQKLLEQQEQRQRQLFEKKLTPKEDFDTANTNLDIVKAEIQLLEAQLSKTTIVAPFDGILGLRHISEGSYLNSNTLITTLQDNSQMKVEFTVPEKYVGTIKQNDSIQFYLQNRADSFTGTIYALDSQIDPQTRMLRMRALSPNPEGLLVSGAFAKIEIFSKERELFMIPSYTLIPDLKGYSVFIYQNGKAESRRVEIGIRTEDQIEVAKGLNEGELLILSAILQLRPGTAVQQVMNSSSGS